MVSRAQEPCKSPALRTAGPGMEGELGRSFQTEAQHPAVGRCESVPGVSAAWAVLTASKMLLLPPGDPFSSLPLARWVGAAYTATPWKQEDTYNETMFSNNWI